MATALTTRITAGTGATVKNAPLTSTEIDNNFLSLNDNKLETTWTGSTSVVTLGTISTGTWSATTIATTKGGTGLTSFTANGAVYASSTSALTTGTLPVASGGTGVTSVSSGQVLIGSTGGTPTPATLTAGPGISIANAAGSITVSGTGSGIGWTEVTGTSQTMSADNGYVSSNAGLVTLTLPTTAAFGTVINIVGKGAGGWKVAQNAGQQIRIGASASTVGATGYIASTNQYDSIELLCTTANTTWTVLGGPQGNITVA